MCAFVIVDPVSCGGHTSRSWRLLEPELARLYPYMSPVFPRRRNEMATLVSAALRDGHMEIVAVGDGTLSQAVNGFFNGEGPLSQDAVLAVLAPASSAVARLSEAAVRPIDIGRVCCLSREGKPCTRYFVTTASFGCSKVPIRRLNTSFVAALFSGRDRVVRLIVDQSFDAIVTIRGVTISNGQVLGHARSDASGAKPGGGQFNVTVQMGGGSNAFDQRRGRRILVAPVEETRGRPVLVDVDGQSVGRLPATFEILPHALNMRC